MNAFDTQYVASTQTQTDTETDTVAQAVILSFSDHAKPLLSSTFNLNNKLNNSK